MRSRVVAAHNIFLHHAPECTPSLHKPDKDWGVPTQLRTLWQSPCWSHGSNALYQHGIPIRLLLSLTRGVLWGGGRALPSHLQQSIFEPQFIKRSFEFHLAHGCTHGLGGRGVQSQGLGGGI